MSKEEIIQKANSNIEILIDKIISKEKEINDSYCVHPPKQFSNCNRISCGKCKGIFYNEKREQMIKKYFID